MLIAIDLLGNPINNAQSARVGFYQCRTMANAESRLIVCISPVTPKLPPKCHTATVYTELLKAVTSHLDREKFRFPATNVTCCQSTNISPALIHKVICCTEALIYLLFSPKLPSDKLSSY